MSRKDYQLIADIFGKALVNNLGAGEQAIWETVRLFEEQALLDNPRFDIFRFEKAIREKEESLKAKIQNRRQGLCLKA